MPATLLLLLLEVALLTPPGDDLLPQLPDRAGSAVGGDVQHVLQHHRPRIGLQVLDQLVELRTHDHGRGRVDVGGEHRLGDRAEFGAAEQLRRLRDRRSLPTGMPPVVGHPRGGRRGLRFLDHPTGFGIGHHHGQLRKRQGMQLGQIADQLTELAGRALEHHGVQITQHVGARGNDLPPIRQRSAAIHEQDATQGVRQRPSIRDRVIHTVPHYYLDRMFPRSWRTGRGRWW